MTYEQIYTTVNAVSAQMWGQQALTTTDLKGLISLGDLVFSSNSNRDGFLNVLVDRIGKTLFRTLDNRVEFPSFIRNEIEYGAIVQKINIDILPAQSAEWANVGNAGFTPNQFKIDKPQISQLLFGDPRLCWEFDLTVPDTLYHTAFSSASQMGAFIDGLMSAMDKSLTESINNLNHMCLCNLIAEKFKAGHNIVTLLTDYNALGGGGGTLTAGDAIYDKDFLRYASQTINMYIKYLSQTSSLYNEGINGNPQLRATQRDNLHCIMSVDFAESAKFNLYSTDFNYEFETLPLYDEFVSLQASGTTAHSPATDMSIDIIPSSEAGQATPTAVQEDYICCVLADREALGTTWRDIYTGTDRNNRNRYTNFTASAGESYFNDVSENCVIFQIA